MQSFSQHVRQRTVMRFRNVSDFDQRRIGFGSGPHRTDQRNPAVEGSLDQIYFRRQRIDRIDRVIELSSVEQPVGRFVPDILPEYGQAQLRVDILQASSQYFRFRPSDRTMQGDQLPVDIRFRNVVGVYDRQRADAAAGEHFGGIGTHASQPDHQYARVLQPFHLFAAQQQFRSFEPMSHAANIFR